MSATLNGTTGITFNDGSKLASALGIFNRVIDGGFIINQRGYVSNTAFASGVYAHDRWKAGASGCTYTFTQGSLGVNTTITITAGSLQQVIEGCNMPEGGTYTLSWTGTAQARVNGGSYGASPLTTTGLTAGANCTIEFNTGTVGSVQMESGGASSSFAFRPYGTELALCQRYYEKMADTYYGVAFAFSGNQYECVLRYLAEKRATPSIANSGTFQFNSTSVNTTASALGADLPSTKSVLMYKTGLTGFSTFQAMRLMNGSSSYIEISAEL